MGAPHQEVVEEGSAESGSDEDVELFGCDNGCGFEGSFGPGPPGAFKRPSRFPWEIHFVWGFCRGAQGA